MIKTKEKIYGWGRSVYSNSFVYRPTEIEEINEVILKANKNNSRIACRGAGRSYGDNTLNENQIVLDITKLNKILEWNPKSGIIKVQGGVTIEKVLVKCAQYGWIFPSMPGTRFVTISGALANNVHGKNAHHKGYIGEYVNCFKIISANNKIYHCSRTENEELFYSAISGLGLLGVIIEVELQLRKSPSFYVAGKARSYNDLESLIEGYEKIKDSFEYSIAWIDAIKNGPKLGRGEINYANFLDDGDFKITNHDIPNNLFGFFPNHWVPAIANKILNTTTMRIINWLQTHTGRMSSDVQMEKVSLSSYHYLMDMKFPYYNYFFKHGFFLYQPILPVENSIKGFHKLIDITHKYGFYSVMSSFKAYREQKEKFLLSFAQDGYSITMDIPKNPKNIKDQVNMFYEMNECVIKYGGKIYLGKTPVLTKIQFHKMYENLNQFISIKDKYDPNSLFESNMFRRIMKIEHNASPMPSEYSI